MGLGIVKKLPWWAVSKAIGGAVGAIVGGVGLVVNGSILEGIALIGVGVSQIGSRHSDEKVKAEIKKDKK